MGRARPVAKVVRQTKDVTFVGNLDLWQQIKKTKESVDIMTPICTHQYSTSCAYSLVIITISLLWFQLIQSAYLCNLCHCISIVIANKMPQISAIISAFIPSYGKTKITGAHLKTRPTKQQQQPGPLVNHQSSLKSLGLFVVGRDHIRGKKTRCRA